uniref:Uncharacterized protein n=1 Tax=Nyssomyia neivai TaxID=330878 RepID=A0A1L8D7R1_9DIPT
MTYHVTSTISQEKSQNRVAPRFWKKICILGFSLRGSPWASAQFAQNIAKQLYSYVPVRKIKKNQENMKVLVHSSCSLRATWPICYFSVWICPLGAPFVGTSCHLIATCTLHATFAPQPGDCQRKSKEFFVPPTGCRSGGHPAIILTMMYHSQVNLAPTTSSHSLSPQLPGSSLICRKFQLRNSRIHHRVLQVLQKVNFPVSQLSQLGTTRWVVVS